MVGDGRGVALAVAVPLGALAVLALGLAGALPWSLAAGIAVTFAPHAMVVDVALAVEIPLVGLFLAVGAYLLGLLVPDQRRIPLLRLRAWLDGASFSVCTLYTIWLLVVGRAGMRGGGLTASLLGSIAAGAVVVGAAHAAQHRRRMLWCGLGAVLSIAGLTALVVTLDYHGTPVATAVAALAIVAAGPLVWYGSTQAQETPGPARLDATGSSGYPLLALPLVGSALATGYQLVQHRSLDVVAIG